MRQSLNRERCDPFSLSFLSFFTLRVASLTLITRMLFHVNDKHSMILYHASYPRRLLHSTVLENKANFALIQDKMQAPTLQVRLSLLATCPCFSDSPWHTSDLTMESSLLSFVVFRKKLPPVCLCVCADVHPAWGRGGRVGPGAMGQRGHNRFILRRLQ